MEIAAFVVAFIALIAALWQGMLSKQQLELARTTKTETEKLLDKIDRKTDEIKKSAEATETSMKEQVNSLLKNFDPSVQAQNKMMENLGPSLMGQIFNSPAVQAKLAEEIGKSFGGKK